MAGHTIPYNSIDRICIRVPNWIGDAVMATPTLRAVREHFPGAHIAALAHSRVERVLQGTPWLDEKIVHPPAGHGGILSFVRTVQTLRSGRFQLGLVLPNSFSSALMMLAGRVRRRLGYARDARGVLLTDPLPRPAEDGRFRPTYMVDYYLNLCAHMGIPAERRDTELPFSHGDSERADSILRRQGLRPDEALCLLHPGAAFGPAKRWPADRFARLAELLAERLDSRLAVIADSSERPFVDAILTSARVPVADLSCCGIDLHLLKPVVARSRLLVTTDSGPRHYGVALGVPTVCIMGPNRPGYSTSGRPHDHVVRVEVDCGPCQRRLCRGEHVCMTRISPDMVLQACHQALAPLPESPTYDRD